MLEMRGNDAIFSANLIQSDVMTCHENPWLSLFWIDLLKFEHYLNLAHIQTRSKIQLQIQQQHIKWSLKFDAFFCTLSKENMLFTKNNLFVLFYYEK